MGVHKLKYGAIQPFYRVLVDVRDRPQCTTYGTTAWNSWFCDCASTSHHCACDAVAQENIELRTWGSIKREASGAAGGGAGGGAGAGAGAIAAAGAGSGDDSASPKPACECAHCQAAPYDGLRLDGVDETDEPATAVDGQDALMALSYMGGATVDGPPAGGVGGMQEVVEDACSGSPGHGALVRHPLLGRYFECMNGGGDDKDAVVTFHPVAELRCLYTEDLVE